VQDAVAPEYIGNYTGTRFANRAVDWISQHQSRYGDAPFFMYLALHNTHAPLEALPEFEQLYANDTWADRRKYYAMVSTVDSSVANVTEALRSQGLFNNTLLVWMTDNGSPGFCFRLVSCVHSASAVAS
jgi:arylsulfatase B